MTENEPSRGYPAEKARQGRIILSTQTRRLVFFGALSVIAIAVIVVAIAT